MKGDNCIKRTGSQSKRTPLDVKRIVLKVHLTANGGGEPDLLAKVTKVLLHVDTEHRIATRQGGHLDLLRVGREDVRCPKELYCIAGDLEAIFGVHVRVIGGTESGQPVEVLLARSSADCPVPGHVIVQSIVHVNERDRVDVVHDELARDN